MEFNYQQGERDYLMAKKITKIISSPFSF